MREVRVLLLTPDYPPVRGGIQHLMHSLVTNWSRVRSRVVTLDAPGARRFDAAESRQVVRVRRLPAYGRRVDLGILALRAVAEAYRFQPDVVVNAVIATSFAAKLIQQTMGAPYIQYLYANELYRSPRLSRWAIKSSAAVIAISEYTATLARACGASPRQLRVIPPGVDLSEHTRVPLADHPTVLTVSRLEERHKGHDVLMRAVPLIRARVPNFEWVIVGDGPLKAYYEALARWQGLCGSIRFVGAVSDMERDAWFDRAHVFSMPSRVLSNGSSEGFGIVFLEAGAHRLPVVAGNVAGALDAVVDDVTGLLVEPTDHVAVANAIADLLLDRKRAELLGAAGAAHAQQFAWKNAARQIEDVVLETVGKRRRRCAISVLSRMTTGPCIMSACCKVVGLTPLME